MSAEVTFIKMREQDIPQVLKLAESVNLGFWSFESYRSEIKNENSVCVSAILKDVKLEDTTKEIIIGFIVARLIKLECYAELYNIAVKETHRNKNIGGNLLKLLIKTCQDNNLQKILLEVRRSNPVAIGFYQKMGFRVLAINKNFYNSPSEDALTMVKNLKSRLTKF